MSLPDRSVRLDLLTVVGGGALGVVFLWSTEAPQSGSVSSGAPACHAEARGLTDAEVWATMRRFVPRALPCVPSSGAPPESTLHLRFEVACTGAIEHVEVTDPGDWPRTVLSCVIEQMSSATFPAHGLVEGAVVDVPIRASFRERGRPSLAQGPVPGVP